MASQAPSRAVPCALLAVCLIAVFAGAPGALCARSPLDGNGMWIWYVSQSGGSAAAIAEKAHDNHVRTVFIKSSDGTRVVVAVHARARLQPASARHAASAPGSSSTARARSTEAERGAEAAGKGADCLVIDAESSYEGRYPPADRYMGELRERVGRDYPVGSDDLPLRRLPPRPPLLGLPRPRRRHLERAPGLLEDDRRHRRRRPSPTPTTGTGPTAGPSYPLGQTYENPPGDRLRRFRRSRAGYGAEGRELVVVAGDRRARVERARRPVHPPVSRPAAHFPRLAQGSRGDTVVQLQALLRAAGQRVGVNGVFGDGTARACAALPGRQRVCPTAGPRTARPGGRFANAGRSASTGAARATLRQRARPGRDRGVRAAVHARPPLARLLG